MSYIDVLIPLIAGLLFASNPELLVRDTVPDFMAKRKRIRIAGLLLIGIAALYAVIRYGE